MSDGTINLAQRSVAPASPTINRSKLWIDNNNVLSTTDSNGVTKSAVGGVFGQNAVFSENTVQISHSVIAPVIYLSLTTQNLPLGNYILFYNFIWSYDDVVGNAAHFNINDNGVQHLPTDITMETKNIFDKPQLGASLMLDGIQGIHTIDLTVHNDDISDTVTMFSAYLNLWRFS